MSFETDRANWVTTTVTADETLAEWGLMAQVYTTSSNTEVTLPYTQATTPNGVLVLQTNGQCIVMKMDNTANVVNVTGFSSFFTADTTLNDPNLVMTTTAFMADTSIGSPNLTNTSVTLKIGQLIVGAGIPINTYITGINGSNSYILSNDSTANGIGVSLDYSTTLTVGQYITGVGIPPNTYIISGGSGTYLMNNNATATGTTVDLNYNNTINGELRDGTNPIILRKQYDYINFFNDNGIDVKILPNSVFVQSIINSATANDIVTVNALGQVIDSGVAITNDIIQNNTTTVFDTEAVQTIVANAIAGANHFRGFYDASSNLFPTTGGSGVGGSVAQYDYWFISVAGTLGGTPVSPSNIIQAKVDLPAQISSNWIINANPTTNTLSSTTNTMSSTVNGINSTTSIINSNANSYNGNNFVSTINGIISSNLEIDGNTILATDPNGSGTNNVILDTVLANINNSSNRNINANQFITNTTTTTTSSGTSVLTVSSTGTQIFNGTLTETIQTPDATTLINGTTYQLINDTSVNLIVNNQSNTLISTIQPTSTQFVVLMDNSTADGIWSTFNGFNTTPIAAGGTGQITALAALNALLPSQVGKAGDVLGTDGITPSWIVPPSQYDATVGVGGNYATVSDALTAGKSTILIVGDATETSNVILNNSTTIFINQIPIWDLGDFNFQYNADNLTFRLGSNGVLKWSPTTSKALVDGMGFGSPVFFRDSIQFDFSGGTADDCPLYTNLISVVSQGATQIRLPNHHGYGIHQNTTLIAFERAIIVFLNASGAGDNIYDLYNFTTNIIPGLAKDIQEIILGGSVSISQPIIDTIGNLEKFSVLPIAAPQLINANIGGSLSNTIMPTGFDLNITLSQSSASVNNCSINAGNIDVNGQTDVRIIDVTCNDVLNINSSTTLDIVKRTTDTLPIIDGITFGNNLITNANLAQVPANTLKGNNTGLTANEQDLTIIQANTMLNSTSNNIYYVSSATGNDTNNGFSWTTADATLTPALTAIGGSGKQIVVAPGTNAGNYTIPNQNLSIMGANDEIGGLVNFTGTLTFSNVASSSKISGLSIANIIQNNAGGLYINNSNIGTNFTSSGSGYVEATSTDFQGSGAATINITSSGIKVFTNNCKLGILTVNNSSAVVNVSNNLTAAPITITAGTVSIVNTPVYAASSATNAITASSGSITYLTNMSCLNPDNSFAKMSIPASAFYSFAGVSYNAGASTIAGINLGRQTYFDAITLIAPLAVSSGGTGQTTTANAINNLVPSQTGNSGKVLGTNGTVVSWQTVAVTNITGTINQVIVSPSSGNYTLSLPQDIGVSSTPTFAQGTITNAPVASTDIVNKNYVDMLVQGLNAKNSCRLATTGNITLSGLQTIDGVLTIANDRILVKNQTTAANNGIYVSSITAWSRSTDMDVYSEVPNSYMAIVSGTVNGSTIWVCTAPSSGTLGITPITFNQMQGVMPTAGTNISITGSTISTIANPTFTTETLSANTNQLVLGTTNTTTVTMATLTGGRTFTLPDANSNSIQPSNASTNQFATGISSTGVIAYAQPAFSNLSGNIAIGQIADNTITNAKLVNMAPNSLKGNNNGSSIAPQDLTITQSNQMLKPISFATSNYNMLYTDYTIEVRDNNLTINAPVLSANVVAGQEFILKNKNFVGTTFTTSDGALFDGLGSITLNAYYSITIKATVGLTGWDIINWYPATLAPSLIGYIVTTGAGYPDNGMLIVPFGSSYGILLGNTGTVNLDVAVGTPIPTTGTVQLLNVASTTAVYLSTGVLILAGGATTNYAGLLIGDNGNVYDILYDGTSFTNTSVSILAVTTPTYPNNGYLISKVNATTGNAEILIGTGVTNYLTV